MTTCRIKVSATWWTLLLVRRVLIAGDFLGKTIKIVSTAGMAVGSFITTVLYGGMNLVRIVIRVREYL